MGKKCKEAVATGTAANANGDYQSALSTFEAIAAADVALDASKDKSLSGHFQKGVAQNKLGQYEDSRASLNQVIRLTEMNENISQRATNYALIRKTWPLLLQ
jgi:tetratricopeptide (TPR) repeat protein